MLGVVVTNRPGWKKYQANGNCRSTLDGNEDYPADNVKYWIADEGVCLLQPWALVGECEVNDPNILPCTEATSRCCDLPDPYGYRCGGSEFYEP